jgi:amphi-Trp domain-containing protein
MPTDKLKFESQITNTQVAEYLETLAAGFRDGELTLQSGDDAVSLSVGEGVSFACNAKASPEKGRAAVEFSVKWQTSPGHEGPIPTLHVLSGSEIEEKVTYAEDFVQRDDLGDIAGSKDGAAVVGNSGDEAHGVGASNDAPAEEAHPRATPRRSRGSTALAARPGRAASASKRSTASRGHARRRAPARSRA